MQDNVVDCDVLLAAKENIQPLHKGRRATALSAVFSTPLVRRDMQLTRQREAHKQEVKVALQGADPQKLLDAYDQFINWTIESYPQGDSAESGIVELIEEATRLLKERHSLSINQNETYLRMWLLYADYVERPLIVYAFLLSNEIGTEHSAFYESYADDLERAKRFKEADDIYSLGIARKAEPFIRLDTRYRSFKRRMLNNSNPTALDDGQSEEPSSSGLNSRPPPQRKVLGDSGRTFGGSGGLLGSGLSIKPKPKPNSCFVFSDQTATGGDAVEPSPWSDLGTKQSRKKENTRPVTKAGDGVPLSGSKPARRVVSAPIRGSFVPFEDDESEYPSMEGLPERAGGLSELLPPAESGADAQFGSEQGSSGSLLQAKAPNQVTESEALKKDPLKNYHES